MAQQFQRKTRKRKQIETASKKSARAKVLKLADKTSNLRAITATPPPDWSVKRRLEFVAWAREVVAGLRGVNEWLEAVFDKAADVAKESVRP
jgi:guanosine-3',5'-bis(diphosphate) 3'-pyrophosphohydrolase